ncbi:MAG: hypothetical protein A2475_02595 [Ignavibacteria bacterium RIFOXYC2_FULL_35_21]|nr:MAG: hypothetical protein A2220_00110 [Ignavibacteria bacterium RIFOXYA2_FULL_35_10]OGV19325.1 MAG: hypothetical protein A2475_02595 [Ignavibacteria bacterium RIFOXYC2_FULL_35_21]
MKITYRKITILLILIFITTLFMFDNVQAIGKRKLSLENLLKKGKIEYIKTDEGWFKIPITVGDETSIIFMYEDNIIKKDPSTAYINILTLISILPKDFTTPFAMMKEVNMLNNNLDFGKVIILNDNSALYYVSGIWSNPKTTDNLMFELYHAHYKRLEFRKTLLPYISE